MKILFASAESTPFVKTGGLADVVGDLPKFLHQEGHQVIVVLPKYGLISSEYQEQMSFIKWFHIPFQKEDEYVGVFRLERNGIIFYFIDNEKFFKRERIYGYEDDTLRFAFFNLAIVAMIKEVDLEVDIIHCHDWHTAMIPVIIREKLMKDPVYRSIRFVLTVHNPAFQGICEKEYLWDVFGISSSTYESGKNRFNNSLSFLKSGIIYADKITTVSPRHAEELLQHEYAHGLEGVFELRRQDLVGILNGIDYDIYNPVSDSFITKKFYGYGEHRKENKKALQVMFHNDIDENVPLVAMVTRITNQKGIELVLEVLDQIIEIPAQFILLGSGDFELEQQLRQYQTKYPNQVGIYLGYNDELAHQIYAGSDIFLMPSRFEPCGISQMIAMRYGCIPVVRQTGGLFDSVTPYNEYIQAGNGFGFYHYHSAEMLDILQYAISFYHQEKKWKKIVRSAMKTDLSWNHSAGQYITLYRQLMQ